MEKRYRMWWKAFLIIAGLFLFCFLIGRREPGTDYEKQVRIGQYETDENVEKIETTILAYGEMIQDAQPDAILTTEGIYTYEREEIESFLYKNVKAYIRDNRILDVEEAKTQEPTVLSNLWISEVEEESVLCFWLGISFSVPFQTEKINREQVADLIFRDGEIAECHFKKEKVTAKLLGVSKDKVSLPGGDIPLSEDAKAYRLYGDLAEIPMGELPIGYENTDFVVDGGKICAFLVTREDSMDTIRVLLQSGNYGGRFHENVEVSADCGFTLRYGEEAEEHVSDEIVSITGDSPYFEQNERIFLTLYANGGRFVISSIERARERTDYRGSLEIIKTEDGLAVINELLLEEYLYAVVPSEMPASYPSESLKAQAVCARTYAYQHMKEAKLPELGAHVDDSTSFQVYGNTEERVETTDAIKATKGQLLVCEGKPIGAYYYSTSCGYGTDVNAWNTEETEGEIYLQARKIADAEQMERQKDGYFPEAEELKEEEAFARFLEEKREGYYESEEVWYRWEYKVDEIDIEEMEQRLSQRYEVQPASVLTETEEGIFASQPIGKIGTIEEISIAKRNAGGGAAQLLITGSEGTYMVQTEYNIRYVLTNGSHPVIRQDGTEVSSDTILPSAFVVVTTGKEEENVVGYTVTGGGYGHGIGMSQNGAKQMALAGLTEEEILAFFYEGSQIEEIY